MIVLGSTPASFATALERRSSLSRRDSGRSSTPAGARPCVQSADPRCDVPPRVVMTADTRARRTGNGRRRSGTDHGLRGGGSLGRPDLASRFETSASLLVPPKSQPRHPLIGRCPPELEHYLTNLMFLVNRSSNPSIPLQRWPPFLSGTEQARSRSRWNTSTTPQLCTALEQNFRESLVSEAPAQIHVLFIGGSPTPEQDCRSVRTAFTHTARLPSPRSS